MPSPRQFHMLAKPIGSRCNMDCKYCFYSEKKALYRKETRWNMSDATLERFIQCYIEDQPGQEVSFLWQGGEPMLMGLDFYRKALKLQQKYGTGRNIHNALQTNGTLLTDEWCDFFHQHHFLIGLSLDGPEALHDRFRRLRSGKPSFHAVMRGVNLLIKHRVEFNITCCVTQDSTENPLGVYRFFKQIGANYIQFAPIVERLADSAEETEGLHHACPDRPQSGPPSMIPGSVVPKDYGRFLISIFDEWIHQDIGTVYVLNFEWALERWLNLPSSYCIFGESCGNALAVEYNGDVYACDHLVYPQYLLGNLSTQTPEELLSSPKQQAFTAKKASLAQQCLDCDVRFACNGECPKNRFIPTEHDGERINYLCPGYRDFFHHIAPYMDRMKQLLQEGKPPFQIKYELRAPAEKSL